MSEEVNQPAESTPGLDQSEIDRLLTQQMAPPQQQVFQAVATRHFLAENLKIEPYDFRNPAFLTELELRRLRLLHEDFIRYLGARLSLFLRMEFGLKMAKLTTLSYTNSPIRCPAPPISVCSRSSRCSASASSMSIRGWRLPSPTGCSAAAAIP